MCHCREMNLARRLAHELLPKVAVNALRTLRAGRDDWLWDIFGRAERGLETVYEQVSTPFATFDGEKLSPEVRSNLLEPSRAFQQRESILQLRRGGYVLPDGGWLVSGSLKLLAAGLIDTEHALRPRFFTFLRQQLRAGGAVRDVPRLIHLRDWGEANYWHFLNDIVGGRLRLVQQMGLDSNIPFLIGQRALEQSFVREIVARSDLGRATIIVQGRELIRFREAICFETPRHCINSIRFFLSYLRSEGGRASDNRRVLLARGRSAARRMLNFAEVQAVCERYGFETVRPESLPIHDQTRVFSEVRYLVAEHGAGLTNIAFRHGAPLSLLEIFPAWAYVHPGGVIGHAPPHYFWLARSLGFDYDALAGRGAPGKDAAGFSVDLCLLEEKLCQMLRKPSPFCSSGPESANIRQ